MIDANQTERKTMRYSKRHEPLTTTAKKRAVEHHDTKRRLNIQRTPTRNKLNLQNNSIMVPFWSSSSLRNILLFFFNKSSTIYFLISPFPHFLSFYYITLSLVFIFIFYPFFIRTSMAVLVTWVLFDQVYFLIGVVWVFSVERGLYLPSQLEVCFSTSKSAR